MYIILSIIVCKYFINRRIFKIKKLHKGYVGKLYYLQNQKLFTTIEISPLGYTVSETLCVILVRLFYT